MILLIKQILSELLSFFGIFFLLESRYFSDKAVILTYHRIIADPYSQPYFIQHGMYVTPATFEKHILFIKKKYKVIFLDDLVDKIKKGDDIGRYCAITFDDGWLDNFKEAYPILTKYRVPATIFLATGFIGTNRLFWPEQFCYLLEHFMTSKLVLSEAPPSFYRLTEEMNSFSTSDRAVYFEKAIEVLKSYLPDEREEILHYLRQKCTLNFIPRQIVNWEETREMYKSGLIRFGAHTDNHVILDQVPCQIVDDEISKSREEIEKRLGEKIRTFAYPNGNHNEEIRAILITNGFDAAVTTCKDFVDYKTTIMQLPRIAIHEDVSNTIPMFRSRILFKKF